MSLFERMQKASSEEDVKDEYIKALHLKGVRRNLIDVQTKEVWFEAKFGSKKSLYEMFTQLLFYIHRALKDGEYIPPFLCVVDSVKAAIMKTDVALPLLQDKNVKIKWGKSASDVTREALDLVSQYIGTHFVSFNIETHEQEFIRVFRTDNNLKFISVYRISQYHFDEDRLDLYAVPKNANNRYVMGINLKVKSDLSFADSSASDDKILEMYLDNRYETSCSIFVLSKRTHYELSASENESNQAAMEFFRDTIRVHALYDVFKQMHLEPACVDSLVLHYTSMLQEQIPVFWKSPNRITTTK